MKKIINNLTENKDLYLSEQILELNKERLINSCEEHIPILLAYNNNTKIGKGDDVKPKPYIRCMCCGLDMSFSSEEVLFDVVDLYTKYNNSLHNINLKFYYYVEQFKNICLDSSNLEKAKENFINLLQEQKNIEDQGRVRK